MSNYIDNSINGPSPRGPVQVNLDPLTGGLNVINNGTSNINGLQVSSSRLANSNSFVSNTFLFPSTISNNTGGTAGTVNYTSPGIRIPAAAGDVLGSLFDASGRSLGFTNGDTVTINGKVGSKSKGVEFTFYDGSDGVNPATTMQDLLTALQESFGLPPTDGTIYNRPSVSMKDPNDLVSDGFPAGAIVIRGQPELAFAIEGITVMGKQADPNQPNKPSHFDMNMGFTVRQAARDSGVHPISDIIFDDSGAQHSFVMTFTHTGTPNEWLWEITMTGGEQVILGGNRGKISFGVDNSPASFTFDDGSNEFRFDPRNGASEVGIKLDVGTAGSHLGITQFESDSTTAVTSQNGYAMGKLAEISIAENGEITGRYTNGINKSIAQIYVAEFNNPAGLLKMGDSMFAVSNNSGHAAMYQPMHGSTTRIKPGALEMSNVELETEFTNMITIQRGYQASARVISTSDQMLQELVQLVR
jgi:flagellar hook protein FlgE